MLFFGTPAFAVPSLEALLTHGHDVVGVVTQPDRPRGRGHHVVASPVKALAESRGLVVLQPGRLSEAGVVEMMAALRPDIGVVAAYGKLLPQRLLDLPPLGMINVHASLLPRWRGAAPVHRAIMAGDLVTGVTIMRVVLALDAGPMLARTEVEIGADETSGELERRLSMSGADLLVQVLRRLAMAAGEGVAQDESQVTYAHRLERDERRLDWERPARDVHNAIRGLQPWPQAAVMFRDRRVILRRSTLGQHPAPGAAPGEVVAVDAEAIEVAAAPGSGTVRVMELQLEGKAPVGARAFQSGHRVVAGDRFEPLPIEAA